MTWADPFRHDGRVVGIPYAALLGLSLGGAEPVLTMPYADALIGAPGRLHGGVVAGMLELAALAALARALGEGADDVTPKPVTITADFLREGAMRETFAAARIVKLGRRLAILSAEAWQADRSKPIATARLTILLDRVSPPPS